LSSRIKTFEKGESFMSISIQYLGSAAFLIVSEKGTRILIDPDIQEFQEVGKVDLILVTHGAKDHLGIAFDIARESGATVVGGPELKLVAKKYGLKPEQFDVIVWGMVRQEGGIAVRAVEARHISFINLDDSVLTGIPLGYIVTTEGGSRIYHMGDTSIFSDLKLIGELYRPQILLVPVGAAVGFFPELSPSEAALATLWIGPEIAIPMHYQPGSKEPTIFAGQVQIIAPHVQVVKLLHGQIQEFCVQRVE
jgi:L-ascorbate metabolism protein UlaG (beta-lactamase superfamily)